MKIGIAQNPFKRLKELQTGSAPRLRIAYLHEEPSPQHARAVERTAHASAAAVRHLHIGSTKLAKLLGLRENSGRYRDGAPRAGW
ncbi:hypothetical protein GCM10019059_43620 [Camelimonas fluminis]|nr:hypothetical protein GCM10019059_43620 [Camelimonas fluminis]